jgi:hypothetical protein
MVNGGQVGFAVAVAAKEDAAKKIIAKNKINGDFFTWEFIARL